MYITAIDLGTSTLKGVVVDLKKSGALFATRVLERESAGIKRGEISHPEETVKPLFSMLKEIKHFDKQCLKNLTFSISGTKSKFYLSRGTIVIQRPDHEILDEDIERVVQEAQAVAIPPGWRVLHAIPREFVVDDIEVDQDSVRGLSGRKLEANVVLVSLFGSIYNNFLKVLHLVLGKKIETEGNGFFAPIASERAVLSGKQRELGVMMLDIGAQTTGVVIWHDGKLLFIKVLPVGSDHITNDIAVGLKCSVETAEKIKREFGAASAKGVSAKEKVDLSQFHDGDQRTVSRKFIAEIIEVRVRELFELALVQLHDLGLDGSLPAGVVLTGGGAKMPGMCDLAREELHLSAQIGVPDLSRFEALGKQLAEQLADPEMAVAVGMALYRVDMAGPKKYGAGNSLQSSYNLNESRVKRFFKTLMMWD